jgi:hypothetical protein
MILFIHHIRSRRHSPEEIRQLATTVNALTAPSSALRTASLRTKLTQLLAQSADLGQAI